MCVRVCICVGNWIFLCVFTSFRRKVSFSLLLKQVVRESRSLMLYRESDTLSKILCLGLIATYKKNLQVVTVSKSVKQMQWKHDEQMETLNTL